MRTFALMLLLASTAAPAMAQDEGHNSEARAQARAERAAARAERAQSQADRPSRAERMESRSEQRAMRIERQSAPVAEQTQSAEQQQSTPSADSGQSVHRRMYQGRQQVRDQQQQTAEPVEVQATTTSGSAITPRQRYVRTIPDTNVATQQNNGTVTTQHRSRDGQWSSSDHRRWDRNHWRSDRRYDWRRYRSHNRSLFHIGLYTDPFGWGYRQWGIGSYLYPSYYSSNFWLDDPWQYRLPPVYGPYRWVRYHDDAILVDIFSGQVVDVIYNFFW